ncbi:cold shock protein [Desulfocurvibacter africanus PCS]|uniref:Cold shock protein n=1 Tax=Desulfocurvibacter africanus PCS TaxID=1262666 RepID=M5Q241_DESAF|nr:cold shock domain-containing protein [Desulfocurvibacter africanus]EMG38121.1 cold shock protein [Desulfocurvibacter africanus PCS]
MNPLPMPDHPSQTNLAGKTPKRRGVVVWFHERRGYGFIRDETGEDVFVSWPDILRPGFKTLAQGEQVTFTLKPGEGGRKAAEVVPLQPSAEPPPQTVNS